MITSTGVGESGAQERVVCVKFCKRYFRKFFSVDFISSSGLWKCGKAERSWRGFSKPLWESAFCADFHSGVISIRPLPFFLFWFFFLSLLLRSTLVKNFSR
jgi:hypothetical protein